jgi:hypothetical protein
MRPGNFPIRPKLRTRRKTAICCSRRPLALIRLCGASQRRPEIHRQQLWLHAALRIVPHSFSQSSSDGTVTSAFVKGRVAQIILEPAERGCLSRSTFDNPKTRGISCAHSVTQTAAGGTPALRSFWATRFEAIAGQVGVFRAGMMHRLEIVPQPASCRRQRKATGCEKWRAFHGD